MSRFRRVGPPPASRQTRETLIDAQQRLTVARMLDQGGVVTPIGPNTHIRIPSGGFGTFPSALVEAVQAARLRQDGVSASREAPPAAFSEAGATLPPDSSEKPPSEAVAEKSQLGPFLAENWGSLSDVGPDTARELDGL